MVLKMTDKKTSDALYVIKSFAILSVIAAHMGFVTPENVGSFSTAESIRLALGQTGVPIFLLYPASFINAVKAMQRNSGQRKQKR